MLSPYFRKLDFYDEDVAEQLTPAEKPAYEKALQSVRELEKEKLEFTTVYAVKDKETDIASTHVLEGGSFTDRREEVPPGFFSAFDPNAASIAAPRNCKSSGRRTALANWITSEANPWTARVMVNRIWHYHFGRGIVEAQTISDTAACVLAIQNFSIGWQLSLWTTVGLSRPCIV